MHPVDEERDVVLAMTRSVQSANAQAPALDLVSVPEARVGAHLRLGVREQRDAVTRGKLFDCDGVIGVTVRAQDVCDRDPVALDASLEAVRQPIAVDEEAVAAGAFGDEIGVRQPLRVLDTLDDHANSITLRIPS
jgi:hypothetical protein